MAPKQIIMRLVLIFLVLSNTAICQVTGVAEKNTIDSIISYSGNKIVFIDFYTVWCGPCKRMDKEVLADKSVSRLVDSTFILLKVDAEKGYGISLSKKYNVTSYPTYVFLNSNATPVYKINGYMPKADFLTQLGFAISESKEKITIEELDSLYHTNKRNTPFLYQYLDRRTRLRLDNSDLLDSYISLLPESERSTIENLQLITNNGDRKSKSLQIGPSLDVLISNSDKLRQLKNAYNLRFYIENAKQKTLKKAIEFKNDSLLNLVVKTTGSGDIFDNAFTIRLEYFSKTDDIASYAKTAFAFVKDSLEKYDIAKMTAMDSSVLAEILNSDEYKNAKETELAEVRSEYKHTQSVRFVRLYNSMNDFLVKNTTDKNTLLRMKKWAQFSLRICSLDKTYFKFLYPHALNTYAKITYQLNEKQVAVASQQKAIFYGSKNEDDEDVVAYQLELKKMLSNKRIF